MKAILWDGHKKINGELLLQKKRLEFRLLDFGETDLDFDLAFKEIKRVSYFKVYEHIAAAIEIISDSNRSNVFIVDEPKELKRAIDVRCETLQEFK